MSDKSLPPLDSEYWNNRYLTGETGWDIGSISTPLKEYFDQIKDKSIHILIPGCGYGYEGEYLFSKGFTNVFMLDISEEALTNFILRNPHFPAEHVLKRDFFKLDLKFDLIVEQTFFCAIDPALREKYIEKAHELLNPGGKIIGLLFNEPLNDSHPPFGGSKEEYAKLFSKKFHIVTMDNSYNSIAPRKDRELFVIFKKD